RRAGRGGRRSGLQARPAGGRGGAYCSFLGSWASGALACASGVWIGNAGVEPRLFMRALRALPAFFARRLRRNSVILVADAMGHSERRCGTRALYRVGAAMSTAVRRGRRSGVAPDAEHDGLVVAAHVGGEADAGDG